MQNNFMIHKAPFLPVTCQKASHCTEGTLRRSLPAYEQKSSLSEPRLILQEDFTSFERLFRLPLRVRV